MTVLSESVSPGATASRRRDVQITNCHLHTFTRRHSPKFFIPFPWNYFVLAIAQYGVVRRGLLAIAYRLDATRASKVTRYLEILEVSYEGGQEQVFETVKDFYPEGTRFVVLPMDMTLMRNGSVKEGIREQHEQLATLRDQEGNRDRVLPFAAVDPRHVDTRVERERFDVVPETMKLIARSGFCGIKLYPPTGYHPADTRLKDLYEFADDYRIPIQTHCSRPAQVQYRGHVGKRMRTDPSGGTIKGSRYHVLMTFTDPDAYRPILDKHTNLQLCLAHFGGEGDWTRYLNGPGRGSPTREPVSVWLKPLVWLGILRPPLENESWLTKILAMIREYDNLWTDISYTLFADDEFVYLLKILLQDQRVRSRVLFGSDFYVVESARLEERRRSVRIRAILGEDVFREIAEDNPRAFLNMDRPKLDSDLQSGRLVIK